MAVFLPGIAKLKRGVSHRGGGRRLIHTSILGFFLYTEPYKTTTYTFNPLKIHLAEQQLTVSQEVAKCYTPGNISLDH